MMPVEVDTHNLALIELESGAIGQMMTSFDVWDSETPRLEIYGEEGTICIADPDPVHGANIFQGEVWLRTRDTARWTHQPRPTGREHWQVAANRHGFNHDARGLGLLDMAYAVRDGRPPRASGQLAYHIYETMEAMLASPARGRFIDVESRCARPEPLPENFPDSGRLASMPVRSLDLAEPFFSVRLITDEARFPISGKTIVLNLADTPVRIRAQSLGHPAIGDRGRNRARGHPPCSDRRALRRAWRRSGAACRDPQGLAVGLRCPRGGAAQRNPALHVAQGLGRALRLHLLSFRLGAAECRPAPRSRFLPRGPAFARCTLRSSASARCSNCREKDVSTLYLEEPMAPGTTHRPMYDEEGNYPWHQFETITPSIFMAVEMLPEGATPPN